MATSGNRLKAQFRQSLLADQGIAQPGHSSNARRHLASNVSGLLPFRIYTYSDVIHSMVALQQL